ncbi:MAG TPA: GntR family transcriptional regulator [Anaerolineae bacterium]|nr:GntR family transcriptional regulator [Anaerolineae bacterium]HQH39276.1 GntR family transcriptional regulator [Anaerolineae bacterium]
MSNYRVDADDPLPRYYQVYVSLEERIRSGEFKPGEALPSERQLVLDYGVSRITIVKALDLLVRDDLVERQHGRGNFVLEHPRVATGMENCRIAFCVPSPSESYILSILLGATRVAMRHQIHLQIVVIGDGPEEAKQINALMADGIDGIILFSRSTHLNAALYQKLQDKHYPFVMVDRYCPEVSTDKVIFADEEAAYRLTEILIHQGHRRIAFLTSSELFATSVRDRLHGYRRALEDHGLPYEERWVCQTIYEVLNLSLESLEQFHGTYLDFLTYLRQEAPTAVVAINNYAAEQANIDLLQIQMALLQAVIDVNAQVADCELNIALATISHKSLNLKHTFMVALALQRGEDLGEGAVNLLIQRLNRTLMGPPQSTVVPMEVNITPFDSRENILSDGPERGYSHS